MDFKNFVWNNFQILFSKFPIQNDPFNIIFKNIIQSIHHAINAIDFPIIKNNNHQYEMSYKIRIMENDLYYIINLIRKLIIYFTP